MIKESVDEGFNAVTTINNRSRSNTVETVQREKVNLIKIEMNALGEDNLMSVMDRKNEIVSLGFELEGKMKNFEIMYKKASTEARYGNVDKTSVW